MKRIPDQGVAERPFVLVVHHSASVRYALLKTLDFDGFDVMTMEDGDEALTVLAWAPPHVIVVDAAAVAAAKDALLQRAEAAHIPVIAFDKGLLPTPVEGSMVAWIQRVRREDGVGQLLAVLHELTAQPLPKSTWLL